MINKNKNGKFNGRYICGIEALPQEYYGCNYLA
jgi:hypothetical protein